MRARHLAGIVCGILLADLSAAGCFDSSSGQIVAYRNGATVADIFAPEHGVCHTFPAGADQVKNRTNMDIVLHQGADCTNPGGADTAYVAKQTDTLSVPPQGLWRSFSTVGWNPPVGP